MEIVLRRALAEFWTNCPDSEASLRAWFAEAKQASWSAPPDIKKRYVAASFLRGDRVVFNIHRNSYRLVVRVKYAAHRVFIRFVGTQAEYDKIDGSTI